MQRTATLIRNQGFMLALAAFVALGALLGTGQRAGADTFFDYLDDTGNSNFLFLPRLHNGNVAAVDAALAAQQGNGELLRLKSNHVLSDPTALALFDNYDVDYVFGDYEFLLAPTNLSTLAGQVGASTMSSDAFVGNFNIYPVFPDPTRPLPTTGSVSAAGYLLSGATMANEALYPGSVSFRGPTSGNSSAPNIISGTFVLPIVRTSMVSQNLDAIAPSHKHIPYVTRFNNFMNNDMDNADLPGHPYVFDTSGADINGESVADQLLSRGDFAVMAAHYRARGADSMVLFSPGVVGYTKGQMQSDAEIGWSLFDTAFGAADAASATLDTNVVVDGVLKTMEETGVVWSGVVGDHDNLPATADVLHLLMSNLDDVDHTISFPNAIDGSLVMPPDHYSIEAGQHLFMEFFRGGSFWFHAVTNDLGGRNSSGGSLGLTFDRNGQGVPEPASLVLLAGGSLLLLRRPRHEA